MVISRSDGLVFEIIIPAGGKSEEDTFRAASDLMQTKKNQGRGDRL